MKRFNLFNGLNINPIPLEFSNSLTTTEFLLAIQSKVNDLLEYLTTIENNLNNNVEELEKEVNEYTDEKITEVNNTIEEINKTVEHQEIVVKNEITQQIATLKEELDAELKEISDFLNLISNGEEVDITGVIESIKSLNEEFDDLKNNFAYVRYKGFNLFEIDKDSLQARIESWTYNIEQIDVMVSALYGAIELAKKQNNQTINNVIVEMGKEDEKVQERVDAVVKEIGNLHKELSDRIEDVTQHLQGEIAELRDNLNSEISHINENINTTVNQIYRDMESLHDGGIVVRPR